MNGAVHARHSYSRGFDATKETRLVDFLKSLANFVRFIAVGKILNILG